MVERLQHESGPASPSRAVGHEKPTPWSSTPFDPKPGAAERQTELALACRRLRTAREQRVGRVDARLRLRRARRRAAPQPRELAPGEVLARLLGGRGLRFAFDARREVRRVARPPRAFARERGGSVAPRSISSTLLVTRSSTWRSWVTRSSPPGNAASHSSRYAMASRSRWLVGSSRMSASHSRASSAASATRFFCPPDS